MPPFPEPLGSIFAVAFGLILGSFLNVCIYRLPLGRSGAALELSSELSRFKITLARLLCRVAPRFGMDAGLAYKWVVAGNPARVLRKNS